MLKSWGNVFCYGIASCLLLVIVIVLVQWFRPNSQIRISKSTTVITTPIARDGMPDYQSELQTREGWACPLADNGAVEFWSAMGQGSIENELWGAMCRYLKIPYADEKEGIDIAYTQLETNLKRWSEHQGIDVGTDEMFAWTPTYALSVMPWKDADCPPLARFLTENKDHIDLLVAAGQKRRFYSPDERAFGSSDDSTSVDVNLPMAIGTAIEVLQLRATNRMGQGRLDEAWQDLHAAMKVATLPKDNFVGFLIVTARLGGPLQMLSQLLGHEKVDLRLLEKIRADFAAFPKPKDRIKRCVYAERLFSISYLVGCSNKADPFSEEEYSLRSPELGFLYEGAVDWNVLLQRANEVFDEMDAAAVAPSFTARQNTVAWLKNLQVEHERHIGDRVSRTLGYLSMQKRSQLIADESCLATFDGFFYVMERYEWWLVQNELLKMQLALAAHWAEHGTYPDRLQKLAPNSIDFVDPYSGNLPRYRKIKDGYLIYSVGPNEVDEQGSGGMLFRGVSLEEIEDDSDPKQVEAFLRRIGEVDCIRKDGDYSDILYSFGADDISTRVIAPQKTFAEIIKEKVGQQ